MGAGSPPSWASGVSTDRDRTSSFTWAPQLQQAQPQTHTQPELDFAEPSLGTFEFTHTQSAQDAEYARNASLPPLESVLELTDAVRPPLRGEEPQLASTSSAGTSSYAFHVVLLDSVHRACANLHTSADCYIVMYAIIYVCCPKNLPWQVLSASGTK